MGLPTAHHPSPASEQVIAPPAKLPATTATTVPAGSAPVPSTPPPHALLLSVLSQCEASAKLLSDALSQRHFSHADTSNRSLLT
jgi:hypothetical protein